VLVRQILEGAAHAHEQGIVHRDLKPDNVLLADQGGWERARIIDFGLVKMVGDAAKEFGTQTLTKTGSVHGTPEYMSPEQALGQPIDHRADLYSIGVILYEALARQLPLFDEESDTMMKMAAKVPPPPLEVFVGDQPWITPALRALVDKSLEKKPGHRYRDAAQMIEALDRAFRSLDGM
jgi:serine/threonine-protein kinase